MALKAVVESLDGLSDEIKALYKEAGDGKFFLQVQPAEGYGLEDVTKLKSTIQALRKNNNDARKAIAPFTVDGSTPKGERPGEWELLSGDDVREGLRIQGEMENWDPEKKADEKFGSLKRQLEEKHAKEINGREAKIKSMLRQLEKTMIDAAAIKAISEKTKIPGAVELLLPHVRNQARLREVDGKFRVGVLDPIDPDGAFRPTLKEGTGDMSISELVDEMSANPTYAAVFSGTGAAGSGASGGTGHRSSGGMSTEELLKLPPEERIAVGRKLGMIKPERVSADTPITVPRS
jgi:hypothetical protein